MKRWVSLSELATRELTAKAVNTNSNMKHSKTDQNEAWTRVWTRSSHFHAVHQAYEQNFMEMHELYMDRFIFQQGSIISHWFLPEFNIEKDSIQESFDVQTLNPDFYMNTHRNFMIQAAVYSTLQDLQDAYQDFMD